MPIHCLKSAIPSEKGLVKNITPTLHIKKQIKSCFVIYSPISAYDIIDVKNGLFTIRIALDIGINSREKTSSTKPLADPKTLAKA